MKNSNDILSRINSKYASMSKGQKILSAYITDHFDQAAFLTAAGLGKEVGVSESTVVRFASFLGYKGYPDFQRAIESVVKGKLDNNDNSRTAYGNINKSKVLRTVLAADSQRIKETLELSDEDTFEAAVEMLGSSRTIYIIGLRNCAPLADIMAASLRLIFSDVRVLNSTNSSELFEQLLFVGPEDVVFAISFPRYSMRVLKALEFANNKNARIITLTDSFNSPVSLYSSCNLIAVTDMSSIIESMVAPLSVINALIIRLSIKRAHAVTHSLDTLDEIWEQYEVSGNDELEFVDDKIKFRYKGEFDE